MNYTPTNWMIVGFAELMEILGEESMNTIYKLFYKNDITFRSFN